MRANSTNKYITAFIVLTVLLQCTIIRCSHKSSTINSDIHLARRSNGEQPVRSTGAESNITSEGIILYIVTSKEGCECFLNLCADLRSIGRDLTAKYGNRIEVKPLDNDADFQEVKTLREAYHLFLLPYVVLVDRRGDYENILYLKSGFEDAGVILKELEMWLEVLTLQKESQDYYADGVN